MVSVVQAGNKPQGLQNTQAGQPCFHFWFLKCTTISTTSTREWLGQICIAQVSTGTRTHKGVNTSTICNGFDPRNKIRDLKFPGRTHPTPQQGWLWHHRHQWWEWKLISAWCQEPWPHFSLRVPITKLHECSHLYFSLNSDLRSNIPMFCSSLETSVLDTMLRSASKRCWMQMLWSLIDAQNGKYRLTSRPNSSTPEHTPKRNENTCPTNTNTWVLVTILFNF